MSKILALGEIMLRLSTSSGDLLSCSQSFNVNYGGSEANVVAALAHFGHDVSFASKIPDSSLGMAAIKTLHANGIDTSHLLFGGKRLGVYYLEQGSTLRNSKVIYDRENSSISQMDIHEWDFDRLFEDVSLFHISGITFALSDSWRRNGQLLIQEAYNRSIPVSFDINFRQAMWTLDEAKETIIPIFPMISYCCANYMDAHNFFGIDETIAVPGNMEECYHMIHQKYPNIRALYSTDRNVISPLNNELQGMIWNNGEFKKSDKYHLFPIVDRIGGGDAFVAGNLHGILTNMDTEQTIQFATATSVLKHSINGDILPMSEKDVKSWLNTPGREVIR